MYTKLISTVCVCALISVVVPSAPAWNGPEATNGGLPGAPPAPPLPILPDPLDCDTALAMVDFIETLIEQLQEQLDEAHELRAVFQHALDVKLSLYWEFCNGRQDNMDLIAACGDLQTDILELTANMTRMAGEIEALHGRIVQLQDYVDALIARILAQCYSE